MKKLYILSLLSSMLAMTACNSAVNPYTEDVKVSSMIPGAEVYADGELVGITPCTLTLSINCIHELKFKKEGFKPESFALTPAPLDSFVKFGPLVDTGYYRTLTPSNVHVEMKPDLLPIKAGTDAFESLSENYLKVDALRQFGSISEEEYNYIVAYMTKFYSEAVK